MIPDTVPSRVMVNHQVKRKSEMLDDVPKNIVETQLNTVAVEYRVGRVEDVAQIVTWLAGKDLAGFLVKPYQHRVVFSCSEL